MCSVCTLSSQIVTVYFVSTCFPTFVFVTPHASGLIIVYHVKIVFTVIQIYFERSLRAQILDRREQQWRSLSTTHLLGWLIVNATNSPPPSPHLEFEHLEYSNAINLQAEKCINNVYEIENLTSRGYIFMKVQQLFTVSSLVVLGMLSPCFRFDDISTNDKGYAVVFCITACKHVKML